LNGSNIAQALSNPNASSPQGDRCIRVGKEPGSAWAYSGGGYAILQLVIEEVTGESFIPFMQQNVLNPLGMKHSRYVIDSIDTNVAPSYTVDGRIVPRQNWINYSSSSFYTSVADMTRFVQAHFKGVDGQPIGRNVLNAASLTAMAEPHASIYGMNIWGMGPVLWAPRSLSENRTRAEGKLV
jgi:CubicO group peptidase (beta-lactamase class C family)